jgi:peptidoglycan/xylan/chitin deacetylase (PgdA/CDA1 family)
MPLLSPAGFETDVRRAGRVIQDVLGLDPRPWFRLPFGSGVTNARLLAQLRSLGYEHSHWDVAPREWRRRATIRGVEAETVDGVTARGDGAVVLMHSWPAPVADVLDGVVRRLRDRGVTFVGLDELAAGPTK